MVLLFTNIMYVGILSNCKYWKFIKLVLVLVFLFLVVRTQYFYVSFVIIYYSHFIGHLLSRYRRISDCSYSIVYGHAGRYAP